MFKEITEELKNLPTEEFVNFYRKMMMKENTPEELAAAMKLTISIMQELLPSRERLDKMDIAVIKAQSIALGWQLRQRYDERLALERMVKK